MLPGHERMHAARCLRARFGATFAGPYRSGKVAMANCLLAELHVPQQHAFEAVEELERDGAVRFVGTRDVRLAEPDDEARGEPWGLANSPLTTSADSGIWTIEPQRSGPHQA